MKMNEARLRNLIKEFVFNTLNEKKEHEGPGRPDENPNKFDDFVEDNGGSEKVADELGLSQGQLNKLTTDGPSASNPSVDTMWNIDAMTSGEISPQFWKGRSKKIK